MSTDVPRVEEFNTAILFGSYARGDHVDSSDVDVLLCTEKGNSSVVHHGRLAFAVYPKTQLLEMAARGDLFVWHIIAEGKVLWSEDGFLEVLRGRFVPPQDLKQVVRNAADLGYLLSLYSGSFPPDLLNRRMAWVVRTILTAQAIEKGRVVFSVGELVDLAGNEALAGLINAKDANEFDRARVEIFELFLEDVGVIRDSTPFEGGFRARFEATGNSFGMKTLYELDANIPPTHYG